jgi:hypothetical protein
MTAHSAIGASSMYRWSVCPGSVRMSAGIPNQSSAYAEEGTAAHEAAAHYLNRGEFPPGVDAETAEAVMVYVNTIFEDERSAYGKSSYERLVEHGFDLAKIYPGAFGTADCVIYYPALKLLRVYDYKHGAGIPVEVAGNSQLKYYGLGALVSLGYLVNTVELIIVQPRCYHADGPVRRWQLSALELLDFAADLVDFAKRTEDPNAPLIPGEHCRFCPAAGVCSAVHEKALTLAKEEFRPEFSYDPIKLGQVLHWLPTLEAWVKSVREFAYQEAMRGHAPQGWKLVKKRATRKWASNVNEDLLAETFKKDSSKFSERKLLSPAQVEKLLEKADLPKLSDLVISESSGATLAPEEDKREAVRLDAKSEFKVIDAEFEALID